MTITTFLSKLGPQRTTERLIQARLDAIASGTLAEPPKKPQSASVERRQAEPLQMQPSHKPD